MPARCSTAGMWTIQIPSTNPLRAKYAKIAPRARRSVTAANVSNIFMFEQLRRKRSQCSMWSVMDRHRQIVDAVRRTGQLSVTELASLTGTSEMTTRRDLEILAERGVLERYRGGARSLLLRGE